MRHSYRQNLLRHFIRAGQLIFLGIVASACANAMIRSSSQRANDAVDESVQPGLSHATPTIHVPFVDPPPLSVEVWSMPEITREVLRFPLLPDEDVSRPRSIGNTSSGFLVQGVAVELPHPHLAFLEQAFERKLFFMTQEMLDLVQDGARYLVEAYPESIVYLGNFSARGGGDIPYSISHNSGRDGDIAFFLNDMEGNPIVAPHFVPLDDQGRYQCEQSGQVYVFDVARNWKLIEGILRSDAAALQYIFVSASLRQMLLEHARRERVPRRILSRAHRLLVQPAGALPHNDHFHLRIHCARLDIASGCVERGPRGPDFKTHTRARRGVVVRAMALLDNPDPAVRLRAVRRLSLLGARESISKLRVRLDDSDAWVRASAARALADFGAGETLLVQRLRVEQEPQVVVEVIDGLGRIGGPNALKALSEYLSQPRPLSLPGLSHVDGRAFAAHALVHAEDPYPVGALMALLDDDDGYVREQAARALRILTNHHFGDDWRSAPREVIEQWMQSWKNWYADHKTLPREQWLIRGFQRAGLDVEALSSSDIWHLCRAITSDDHLSFNAQRVLMQISGREPASLSWPKEDASVYWRRWFERRWEQHGYPPIPPELSTLIPVEHEVESNDNAMK